MPSHSLPGIREAVRAIRKARKILILSHVNPDGDTIGGQLALGLAFLQMGKSVMMANQDGVPARLQFLPGSELILTEAGEIADLAIAVDCGSENQLGILRDAFLAARQSIQIDHHDFGQPFGKIQLLEMEAAAVGEIVYELIRALKVEISPAMASCLLTSIVVDTGAFRFTNVRAKTFEICAKLIKKGVDIQHLIEEAYWRKSRSMARLSGYCMSQVKFSENGALCWAVVYQKDFRRFSAEISDVDAVADELRSIEGVRVAAVLRETQRGHFRASLRSTGGINVATAAKRHGGGGHHNSAGCTIGPSQEDLHKFLKELEALAG